ncbi:MAG: hypothetical protein ABIN94_22775 [Ferruginibacter sp.]
MTTFISILIFVCSIALLVVIRTNNNGKYEIKLTDVIIGLIPIVLWLLLTGRILEFEVGDLKVKFKEAYQKPVLGQVTSLIEGRQFISVGVDCTYGKEDDIQDQKTFPSYFPFKYIIIEEHCEDDKKGNSNPAFWGMLSVDDYKQLFLDSTSKLSGSLFIQWVKSKNIKELERTTSSFISINDAINLQTTKLTALEQMEKLKSDILPVIDDKRKFLGIVERSRLNASFLIDIGKDFNSK